MGSALAPAKETPFVIPHEALSREDRVHLVPDDLLGEIQPRRLEGVRIVGNVRIPAPNKEKPSGEKSPPYVPKPAQQHRLERLVRYKVIDQRSIPGPHLFAGWFRFFGMALDVKFLVMLRTCERREPHFDCVVASWFGSRTVRRVGV